VRAVKDAGLAFIAAQRRSLTGEARGLSAGFRRKGSGSWTEHGMKQRDLASAMERAKGDRAIDRLLYGWANELRVAKKKWRTMGSETTGKDARDLLEFTEAILG